MRDDWRPDTRAVHAGLPAPEQGAPFLPGPVLAAPFHLRGDLDGAPSGYARDGHPTWAQLEEALGALDGGESVVFPSGMGAMSAVLEPRLGPGDVLVACRDGYPGVRAIAAERLVPRGVEVRLVPTDTQAILDAIPGARLVWVETPANPRLDVCDLRAVAEAARAAGALLAVDNTVATPLGQRPLDLGADIAITSGTKSLTGHSDVLMGVASVRDGELAAALRRDRSRSGAVLGPFEAWLAHRSLATLGLRLTRQSESALALARMLHDHADVLEVRHPGLPDHPGHAVAAAQMRLYGCLVGFTLASAQRAQAFLDASELIAEATSFGGVHSTAERRARWGTDEVAPGFVRLSLGCEDPQDLLADVAAALDAASSAEHPHDDEPARSRGPAAEWG